MQPAPPARQPGLAISSPALDAWPVPLPEGDDEAVIRLPAPTRVEIEYDIEGSDDEASVFLQSLMHDLESWKGFEIIRHLPVRNQGRIEITSLPPGKYQFARSRSLRHGNIGQGVFLDRRSVELTSDKPTIVSFVRKTGARLSGSVEWDEKIELDWERQLRTLVSDRQFWCRALAALLRQPILCRLAMAVVRRMPALAAPAVRAVSAL